ncbi:MAG: Gfo/Idh/MocA family oxidoreductase [Longimicrobiales bacterium]|nr:Gfo/Idh/MocA family oxidoreductase [Longimicrobiales bacterium]
MTQGVELVQTKKTHVQPAGPPVGKTGDAPAICVLGCGAITESFYLPALTEDPKVRDLLLLVDPDVERARAMARRFGVSQVAESHQGKLASMDGVIVATPHHLHHPLSMDALEAGCHVLCEKPLAVRADDAVELVEEAATRGRALAVNNTRRLYPIVQEIRRFIGTGALGRIRRIEIEEGDPFEWPAASGFYFQAEGEPRGVLLDLGAHVLDLLSWWLGPDVTFIDCRDDSGGGPEAVTFLRLALDGAPVDIRLSRLSSLSNRYRIEGEKGVLDGETGDWQRARWTPSGGRSRTLRGSPTVVAFDRFARILVTNFLHLCTEGGEPLVPGRTVVPSLRLIDRAYAARRRFDMPWLSLATSPTGVVADA